MIFTTGHSRMFLKKSIEIIPLSGMITMKVIGRKDGGFLLKEMFTQ